MTIHLPAETAMAIALAFNDSRISAATRRAVAERAVDDLIAYLDEIDGDSDYEPEGIEADQSWPEMSGSRRHMTETNCFEDAEESEATEDEGLSEPTLGSPEVSLMNTFAYTDASGRQCLTFGSQEDWARGSNSRANDDAEYTNEDGGDILDVPHDDDKADYELNGDDEPNLAWTEAVNQTLLKGWSGPEDAETAGDRAANAAGRREAKDMLRGVVLRDGLLERVVVVGHGSAGGANVRHLDGSPVRCLRMVGWQR